MNLLYKAQTRFLFHAHIKIKISIFYDDELFDELFAILEEVDRMYNSYQSGSFINKINLNAGYYTEVDKQTIEILSQVKLLSEYFDNEYDITIMPLIRLWGFYKDEGLKLPTPEEITQAMENVNYRNIRIKGNKVSINKNQEIITGSFIKAFAIDKLKEKMEQIGINDTIINAGGSTILTINNDGHPYWQVAVRNPDDDKLMFTLKISDKCYSTSSQSKTFLKIGDKQYGHIISPVTGYPSQNKQVGIITNKCMDGDIISTGLFNETTEGFIEKMNFLRNIYPEIEGYLIDRNGTMVLSNGFNKYIIQ